MPTRLFAAGLAAVALAVAPSPAAAQEAVAPEAVPEAVPDVTVTMSSKRVRLAGADSLTGGPTRFTFSVADRAVYRYGMLYRLKPGKTAADLRTALRKRTPRRFFSAVEIVVASSVVRGRSETRSFSVTLQPSTTYAALEATPRSHRRWRVAVFSTTADISSAQLPEPAATITVRDGRIAGSRLLPKRGTIRFNTTGDHMHSVTAYRLRRSATNARVKRALRRKDLRSFHRLTIGSPIPSLGLMNSGTVDAELAFPRKGRYVLVCLHKTGSKAHHRRGERLIVTVR